MTTSKPHLGIWGVSFCIWEVFNDLFSYNLVKAVWYNNSELTEEPLFFNPSHYKPFFVWM